MFSLRFSNSNACRLFTRHAPFLRTRTRSLGSLTQQHPTKYLRRTSPAIAMAPIDDEFGLSSDDEAELLGLDESGAPIGKRKRDDEDGVSLKRSRSGPVASAAAIRVANEVLKKHFRIPSFRLKQEAAIARLLDGESAVVVFPTGGGKSLVRSQCA